METLMTSYKPIVPTIPLEPSITDQHIVPRRLKGLAASSGVVQGPCTIIRDLRDLQTLDHGAILLCEVASPKVAPFMPRLKGLIAEQGGPLAIASGYAREYGIPAVLGVKGLMDSVRDGDVVRVDGSRGTVELLHRGPSWGSH